MLIPTAYPLRRAAWLILFLAPPAALAKRKRASDDTILPSLVGMDPDMGCMNDHVVMTNETKRGLDIIAEGQINFA
jgi:hypothetical protein